MEDQALAQDQPNAEPQDSRPGYEVITTGSTKHPEAKNSENGTAEAAIGVFLGDTLADAVEKYGEDFVFNNYKRNVVVSVQGKVRRALDAGTPISTVEEEFDDLDPTEQRSTIQDPQVIAMRAFMKMDPEKQAEFLAGIQAGG